MLLRIKMLARMFNKKARLDRMQVLSDATVKQLSGLVFRSEAQSLVNLLPFGSVYWADEMPDTRQLILCGEQDCMNILRMFSIRLKLWDAEALSDEENQLWNSIRSQVPTWPIFRRLTLTDEEKLARKEVEKQVESEFESLSDDAAEI
jgi:hypothetical protein